MSQTIFESLYPLEIEFLNLVLHQLPVSVKNILSGVNFGYKNSPKAEETMRKKVMCVCRFKELKKPFLSIPYYAYINPELGYEFHVLHM
jgi:hypothetical protein